MTLRAENPGGWGSWRVRSPDFFLLIYKEMLATGASVLVRLSCAPSPTSFQISWAARRLPPRCRQS